MRRFIAVAILNLSLVFPSFSRADERCGADTVDEVAFRWCIAEGTHGKSRDILYFLHGRGGSEHSWADNVDYQRVRDHWVRMGIQAPTVVTISFGPSWLLTKVNEKRKHALLPYFISKLIPHMESRLGGLHGRRLLIGESMGGFNSLQILFAAPDLFHRIAFVCPGIPTIGPYATSDEIEALIQRHQPYIRRDLVESLLSRNRSEFPTTAHWDAHDPLKLMLRTESSPLSSPSPLAWPPLHLSSNEMDEYGFQEGAVRLVEIAQGRNISVEWISIPSTGHCVQSPESIKRLADFLSGGKNAH
jgi:pimeloyl-ACP methyl ester carboxylesterase